MKPAAMDEQHPFWSCSLLPSAMIQTCPEAGRVRINEILPPATEKKSDLNRDGEPLDRIEHPCLVCLPIAARAPDCTQPSL